MRCTCCDRALSDYESTLRHAETGEFLDTCTKCLKGLSIASVGREDLLGKQEAAEEIDDGGDIYGFDDFNDAAIGKANSDLGPMLYEDTE